MTTSIVLVNKDKAKRATDIIDLLGRAPKSEDEGETKTKFTALLKDSDVDVKDKDTAIQFVYEKLGGLIRTVEQDKKIKEKVAKVKEAKKSGAKKATEDDEDDKDEDDDDDN